MAIRLIALDLDGTLLNSQKQISKETLETLSEAAQKGILIVPCTGRLYKTVPEAVKCLPFVRYMITVNGARIYDHQKGTVLYQEEIPIEVAEHLYDYIETLPAVFDCYQDNEMWINKEFYDRAEELFEDDKTVKLIRMRKPVENFRQVIRERNKSLEKIMMFFYDEERRLEEWNRISVKFPMCSVVCSRENNLEISAVKATKGEGLKCLCSYLGINLNECMALGDQSNDLSMLKLAGISVAMGNAKEEVKNVADWVTTSNDLDGVAMAIRRYRL